MGQEDRAGLGAASGGSGRILTQASRRRTAPRLNGGEDASALRRTGRRRALNIRAAKPRWGPRPGTAARHSRGGDGVVSGGFKRLASTGRGRPDPLY